MNFATALRQRLPDRRPATRGEARSALGMDCTTQRRKSFGVDVAARIAVHSFADVLDIRQSVVEAKQWTGRRFDHERGVSSFAEATVAQSASIDKWVHRLSARVIRDEAQRAENAAAIALIDELLEEGAKGFDENARRDWEEMKASLDAHRSSQRKLFP